LARTLTGEALIFFWRADPCGEALGRARVAVPYGTTPNEHRTLRDIVTGAHEDVKVKSGFIAGLSI